MSKITLNEPWKKLVWVATTVCNYNCTYCAPGLHDNKNRWPENYYPVIDMINQFRKDDPAAVAVIQFVTRQYSWLAFMQAYAPKKLRRLN